MSALSDANLRTLVSEVILGERQIESPEGYRIRVEQRCRLIRSRWVYADGAATIVQHRVGVRMAMESAAAAICADPDKFQRALGGETVDVKLFDVALLTGDEFRPWTHQYAQHRDWGRRAPAPLAPARSGQRAVRRFGNRQRSAVRALGGRPGSRFLELRQPQMPVLFSCSAGSTARELGGDVTATIELNSCVPVLRNWVVKWLRRAMNESAPCRRGLWIKRGGLAARNTVTRLQAEMARLERNARALEQAGRQLKDMRSDSG